MTKNEIEMLEDWIKYHGFVFGLDNLFVLDGSDDPRVFEIYDRYQPRGLNVHRSSTGLNGLAAELTALMQAHKAPGDFLIKLDTDEFLAWTDPAVIGPKDRPSRMLHRLYHRSRASDGGVIKRLGEAAVDRPHRAKTLTNEGVDRFFAELPVTGQRYKAGLIAWSVPRSAYVARPATELTEFTPLHFTYLKSFFHADSFVSVDLGGHNGVATRNDGFIETGLTVLHYHSTSVEDAVRRARTILLSHDYIDEDDDADVQRRKLADLLEREEKPPSFSKLGFFLEHLDAEATGRPLDPMQLNARHPHFRRSGPNTHFSLVRDTLNRIDRDGGIAA